MKLKLFLLSLARQTAWILVSIYQQEAKLWGRLSVSVVLFVFCLLQIQVGLRERSQFMINLGTAFIALDIFTTYIRLIDSMSRTGTMFLASGAFLIAFGGYLEKKRRMLMQQIISGGSNSEAIG